MHPSETRQENWRRCKDKDPDISIGGCTSIIEAGQETTADLSTACRRRGCARQRKGDYDGAIADYDEAIRLKPEDANIVWHRAYARLCKGDYDSAIADYDAAIPLKPEDANIICARDCLFEQRAVRARHRR